MNTEQEIAEKLQTHRKEKASSEQKKPEVKTFAKEELENISKIKETYDSVTLRMGQLVFEEKSLINEREELERIFNENRKTEVKFAQELNTKYGKGTLDIQTGIFTPVE